MGGAKEKVREPSVWDKLLFSVSMMIPTAMEAGPVWGTVLLGGAASEPFEKPKIYRDPETGEEREILTSVVSPSVKAQRKPPKTGLIAAMSEAHVPLTPYRDIAPKDQLFHWTYPSSASNIIESGKIRTGKSGATGQSGVSTTRSSAELRTMPNSVRFGIDPSAAKTESIAEPTFGKTTNTNWENLNNTYSSFMNPMAEYEQRTSGGVQRILGGRKAGSPTISLKPGESIPITPETATVQISKPAIERDTGKTIKSIADAVNELSNKTSSVLGEYLSTIKAAYNKGLRIELVEPKTYRAQGPIDVVDPLRDAGLYKSANASPDVFINQDILEAQSGIVPKDVRLSFSERFGDPWAKLRQKEKAALDFVKSNFKKLDFDVESKNKATGVLKNYYDVEKTLKDHILNGTLNQNILDEIKQSLVNMSSQKEIAQGWLEDMLENIKNDAPKKMSAALDEAMSAPMDISHLAKTGEAQGSNPGGWYSSPNGHEYYVKFYKDPNQAKSEVLADSIYKQLHVPVKNSKLAVDADGNIGVISSKLDLKPMSPKEIAEHPEARGGYLADALLGNWDAIGDGFDNILLHPEKGALRVDTGGSLFHRAQGGAKDFPADRVDELKSLMEPGRIGYETYSKVTPHEMENQLAALNSLSYGGVESLVKRAGFSEDDVKKYTELILGRRNKIQDDLFTKDGYVYSLK